MRTEKLFYVKGMNDKFITRQAFLLMVLFLGFLYTSIVVLSMDIFKVILLYGLGMLLWTLVEYAFIRFMFHSLIINQIFKTLFNDFHYKHHLNPKEKKYLLIPIPLILVIFLLIFLLLVLIIQLNAVPVMFGFITGYIVFEALHYLQHYYQSPSGWYFKHLWQNHFLHHNLYPQKAFGVSTLFWDRLFRTMPPVHKFICIVPNEQSEYIIDKDLKLVEVNNEETIEYFHSVSRRIYRKNLSWIPPLEHEIENIFDPEKNSYFKHGTAKRWVLVNGYNEVLGRIAAFIDFDNMYEDDNKEKIGSIGFFESVNNIEVSNFIFDHAIGWLKEMYRIDVVQGPVNFGENDKYWGLLVEGFSNPSYGMNYNPYYYKNLFENYGFKIQYNQLTNYVSLSKPLPERFEKIAARVIANSRYSFKHFIKKDQEQFILDFVEIYNKAWSTFKNFHPISYDYVKQSFNTIKSVLEEEFIWFAYVDNKPAGLMVATPNVNEVLKYLNGKLNWWTKLKFFFYKTTQGFSSVRVIIMGVVPEYQRHGLESGMTYYAYKAGKRKKNYKHIELAWVGDFNPKMISIHNSMGAVLDKKHATYRMNVNYLS